MKADFTRDTFDPLKYYSRVFMQQGRVQVDADWNEQVAILLHLFRSLAADVIGPYGGPGFAISRKTGGTYTDLLIGYGHYYVDGWLVDNRWDGLAGDKPKDGLEWEARKQGRLAEVPYVVYLDVWERHVTYLDDPAIREVALGGADTATRARVFWRLGVLDEDVSRTTQWTGAKDPEENAKRSWEEWKEGRTANRGLLRARATDPGAAITDPCLTHPEAKYRGPENQLYRVEIHEGGAAASGAASGASFKWSRDDGSVVFAVQRIDLDMVNHITTVTLDSMPKDDRSGLERGDWVELFDDDSITRNAVYDLLQVQAPPSGNRVILAGVPHPDLRADPVMHAQLRRWDEKESEEQLLDDGAVSLVEGVWIDLEDGVQVWFEAVGAKYRTGDYWLVPARVATGDVEWPEDGGDKPSALGPRGVEHHYAPLAYVDSTGNVDAKIRRGFDHLATSP